MSLSTEFRRYLSRTLKSFEKGQFHQVDLDQHGFEGRTELQIIKSLTNIQGSAVHETAGRDVQD